jgi:hypothetical protein
MITDELSNAGRLWIGVKHPEFISVASSVNPRRLPVVPCWPGFLIDSIFYALILWLLIPGPFVLRRLIRIKRGRCPKCGYDLRGDLKRGCPECGWNREAEATE